MTIAYDQNRPDRRGAETAANNDHVSHDGAIAQLRSTPTSDTGGWDAYDVWRRLIKEARERRAGHSFPQ